MQFGVKRWIEAIVWHDMEGFLAGAISRWNTGAAGAHLCILRSGEVVRTCALENIAWHAGTHGDPSRPDGYGRTPFWRTHNINPASVGVELEGFVTTGYTAEQAQAVGRVSHWLMTKYPIPPVHSFDRIPGHHAHGELSAARSDPGPHFDWSWTGVDS